MSRHRKLHVASAKARVALEAVKERETVAQNAKRFDVHPTQVNQWKRKLLDGAAGLFERENGLRRIETFEPTELYEQIGRLKMELDWLKKNLPSSPSERRRLLDADGALSVAAQCDLLDLARSTYYYEPARESAENLALMRRIDEQYLETPFYGSRRMADELSTRACAVNRKRVQRLMRTMGIEAICPRRSTSTPGVGHRVYPYLLRGLAIDRANQVWSSDITYVPMERGFMYRVAVMDWHSRYVLSWRLSNTLESDCCVAALEEALRRGTPEIFNTDQGSQFTSRAFTDVLVANQIALSMDGRGRALDNVFIERLWWSVKHQDIDLKAYGTVADLEEGLRRYFEFYNHVSYHHTSLCA